MKYILILFAFGILSSTTIFAATISQQIFKDGKTDYYLVIGNGGPTVNLWHVVLTSDAGVIPETYNTLLQMGNAAPAQVATYLNKQRVINLPKK